MTSLSLKFSKQHFALALNLPSAAAERGVRSENLLPPFAYRQIRLRTQLLTGTNTLYKVAREGGRWSASVKLRTGEGRTSTTRGAGFYEKGAYICSNWRQAGTLNH